MLAMLVIAAGLSRLLSSSEYGTYRQSFLAFDFVTPLLLLGLPQALFVLIPRNPEQARGLAMTNMGMLALSGLAYGVFLWSGGSGLLSKWWGNPQLATSLQVMALYGLLLYPTLALPGCLMGLGKAHLVLVYNLLSRAVTIVCVAVFVILFGAEARHALGGVIAGTAVGFVVTCWLAWRATAGTSMSINLEGAKKQLAFALPVGLAGMLGALSMSLDRLIVSAMTTPAQYALYANGAIELPLVGMVTGSITAVILPEMAAAFARGSSADAFELWRRVSVKSALLLFPACALFMVVAEPFVVLLYSDRYAASAIPFRYYLLLLPARIVTFGALFQALDKPREVLFYSAVGLLGNMVSVYLAILVAGPLHAAFGAVAGFYLVFMPYVFLRVRKHTGAGISSILPWRQLGLVAVCSVIAAVAASVPLPSMHASMEVLVRMAVFGVALLPGYSFIGPARTEIYMILDKLSGRARSGIGR